MYLQRKLVILAITVSMEMNIMCFSITPPGGHIRSLIMPKFGTDIEGIEIHHHTKAQLSKSNSKEMCHPTVKF